MIKLLVAISYILCTPISAFAELSNIRQMSQNSNGYFNVICLNGHRETASSEMILKNLVCQTATDRSSSVRKAVICTGNEFQDWFYVTRIADGKQFGDFGEKLSLKRVSE
ncbi:hypothetical protein UH38_22795 [Aliterella atlantica CENA595]|uniref:Uncharacterized protein n=2 Tax=Aliterella TaxID=1827277 RepID=A0A0D8ZLE5_9CYAN|nr:hypothetical protein UH38_22795 [Aliterella atlantica CENA595]